MLSINIIYTLAHSAVVISSAEGRGGTWAGAIENLQHNWVPFGVRQGEKVPGGDNAPMKNGAKGIKAPLLPDILEYRCKCTVESDGSVIIHHERSAENFKWCLITYRNTARYPAVRVEHFECLEEAQAYIKKVEPAVPLLSLGGKVPKKPLPYKEFLEWKATNNLRNTIIKNSLISF